MNPKKEIKLSAGLKKPIQRWRAMQGREDRLVEGPLAC
jgi:hypothetical protein